MRFESYAQQLEDLILYCALKNVSKGFYIDVGANDPTDMSVTKFFYDRGWHGINIDPLTEKCGLLDELRPRDVNLCIGLGNKRGKSRFYKKFGLSTFSTEIAEKNDLIKNKESIREIFTLSEIYERYCSPQQEIHFCKIDVENYEKEVLEGVSDWNKFRPWIFAIESTLPCTMIPSHEKWEHILLASNYMFVYQFGVNRYYVAYEKGNLQNGFLEIEQFIAQNDVKLMRMQDYCKVEKSLALAIGGG